MRTGVLVFLALLLAGCGSGAVIFAPTPLPPDVSPLNYTHPTAAFAMFVPRSWSVYEQNNPTLASASFTPPHALEPVLTAAAVNLGRETPVGAFGTVIDEYQSQHRPDLARYVEQERQAMGDGSWRISGVRTLPGGQRQQINTFVQQTGTYIGVIDLVVPADAAAQSEVQTAINTFVINPSAALLPSELSTLSFVRRVRLDIANVTSWTNAQGVFFVTGEVANYSPEPVAEVPVRVALQAADGTTLQEAVDVVMGYSIPPGGFAPFSLRFGEGQPAQTTGYTVTLGAEGWVSPLRPIYGAGTLSWTDSSTFTADNQLEVTGTVTNDSETTVYAPLVLVTVFDVEQHVIGAWFAPVGVDVLIPGQAANFEVRVSEIGGSPVNYIVEIQGLSEEQ